jgi:hypothetical protein
MQGRLYLKDLILYTERCPTICGVLPQIGRWTGAYHDLMLPIGFTGTVTVIPTEDEFRTRTLYFCIPQDDEQRARSR